MRINLASFRSLIIVLAPIALCFPASAQRRHKKEAPKPKTIYEIDTLIKPIPLNRQKLHDDYRRAMRGADATDGKVDGMIWYGEDSIASNAITQAMLHTGRHLDTMIENLPFTDRVLEHNAKLGYLRAINEMVLRFNRDGKYDPYYWRKVVLNMHDLIIASHENRLEDFVHKNANVYTLANVSMLDKYPALRAYVYSEVGKDDPRTMVRRLSEFAHEPFACDIIAAAARVVPNDVYNYASSTNTTLSGAVRRCNDPLVQTIVRIATQSKSPLKAMSFLSDIYTANLTIVQVDIITANDDLFFKNLVRLKLKGDTLGGTTYTDELQYRGLKYIRTMNDLHESPDPVRFKCVDGFTPEELYFLMVYGQNEIYTSSFIGTFNRLMIRMKPSPGDSLFEKVHYEHFRTFIRMCAAYSKLTEFFATMTPEKKTDVMRDFVANLEQGRPDDLEDAVDVADAYGSIEDSTLTEFLRGEIRKNYDRVSDKRIKKGLIVYGLLATIFKGNTPDSLSTELNLPPINLMPNKLLLNDSGVVYEQFFFYGDEDGRNSFASFQGNFKDNKWKIVKEKQWWVISSTSGKPIVIYANIPLPEPEDEEAQKALAKYLAAREIHPTIVVHRGHSYHLTSTMEYLDKASRIVILGSCGGYQNLGKILDRSPDAQIISTKQTGAMAINEPIIKVINNHLLAGDDIEWISTWNELSAAFKGKGKEEETFKEYVPPHRNLGAIFIKAYRRMSNEMDVM